MTPYWELVEKLSKDIEPDPWQIFKGIELAQTSQKNGYREVEKKETIAFSVFDYDARGYDAIILDPLFAMSLGS